MVTTATDGLHRARKHRLARRRRRGRCPSKALVWAQGRGSCLLGSALVACSPNTCVCGGGRGGWCVRLCVCVCVCARARMHACMHASIRTHRSNTHVEAHTHTHTPSTYIPIDLALVVEYCNYISGYVLFRHGHQRRKKRAHLSRVTQRPKNMNESTDSWQLPRTGFHTTRVVAAHCCESSVHSGRSLYAVSTHDHCRAGLGP